MDTWVGASQQWVSRCWRGWRCPCGSWRRGGERRSGDLQNTGSRATPGKDAEEPRRRPRRPLLRTRRRLTTLPGKQALPRRAALRRRKALPRRRPRRQKARRAPRASRRCGSGGTGLTAEEEASASASPSGGDPLVDNGLGSPLCGKERARRTVAGRSSATAAARTSRRRRRRRATTRSTCTSTPAWRTWQLPVGGDPERGPVGVDAARGDRARGDRDARVVLHGRPAQQLGDAGR